MTARRRIWLSLAGLILILGTGLIVLSYRSTVYAVYYSPKGKYRLVVYAYRYSLHSVIPAMPGGGGTKDRPGFVRLYGKDGKLYGKADVPWLQEVDRDSIRWGDGEVFNAGDDGFRITMPKE